MYKLKGNLLANIKDRLVKMSKNKFKDLNVIAYYKCLEDNLSNLEELIISSEYKEHDLSITKDEESGVYTIKVMFLYNVPNIVFHLNFVVYEDIAGKDYRLEVIKTEEMGYFDYDVNNQEYENAEELQCIKDTIESKLIEQIAFEEQYIEMRRNNLINLKMKLAKLTA